MGVIGEKVGKWVVASLWRTSVLREALEFFL